MLSIRIDDIEYNYPGSWDDLSKKQLLFIIDRFLLGESASSIKLRAMLYFLNLSVVKCKPFLRDGITLNLFKDYRNRPVYLDQSLPDTSPA